MSYRIEVAPEFARRLKKLSKRYKSIKQDYEDFLHSLQSNPLQGVDLGKGLRKIRMSIIELLTIYDKSEMESISDKELLNLMKRNGLFQSIITQNPAGITASRILRFSYMTSAK